MNIALVVVSDGRDTYTEQSMGSLGNLKTVFSHQRVVDDSGGTSGLAWPSPWEVVRHQSRRGLAAAVQSAWAGLPSDITHVFHLESDFVVAEPVDVEAMADTLDANPALAQLVLKRQPGNPVEAAAGGIIETAPDEYIDRDGWVEHHRIFSLNPCLIPAPVVSEGWPAGNEAEQTARLLAAGWSFGFWGARHDPPRVIHIGTRRAQGWMP